MAKTITRAKLENVTKKPKTKPKEPEPVISKTPSEIRGDLDRALVALKIEDHLHAIAAEVLDSATTRKDRTGLYLEFIEMLGLAPVDVRSKVVGELEFMLKEPEQSKDVLPMNDKTTGDLLDDAILGGTGPLAGVVK